MLPVEAISGLIQFFARLPEDFDSTLASWGWPAYRGSQIRDWVYQKLVADPQQMSNLSKADRQRLCQAVSFVTARVASQQTSQDGTQKLYLQWPDGSGAETVMIPQADRRTACVSTQVGCPVGCRFCASGIDGVRGNLSTAQIVEQVFLLNCLLQHESLRITHVVFMGMGEPLANYSSVLNAVRVLHDPQCFNISARKITISTVGLPARIRQLAQEELPLNLAISLHAPNEALRRQLIPWAEHFSLKEILDAARFYFDRTGREITLEYILLRSVNDHPAHARQLTKVCQSLRANVNLIPYNPVPGLPFERPRIQDLREFQMILKRAGVNVHVRRSRGRDIEAACGQLRRRTQHQGDQT